jgi:hypothetical protein
MASFPARPISQPTSSRRSPTPASKTGSRRKALVVTEQRHDYWRPSGASGPRPRPGASRGKLALRRLYLIEAPRDTRLSSRTAIPTWSLRVRSRMRCIASVRPGTNGAGRRSSATSPGSQRVPTCGKFCAQHWTSRSTSSTSLLLNPRARSTRRRRSNVGSPSAVLTKSFSRSRKGTFSGRKGPRRSIRSGPTHFPSSSTPHSTTRRCLSIYAA